jgi:hypothetical protein
MRDVGLEEVGIVVSKICSHTPACSHTPPLNLSWNLDPPEWPPSTLRLHELKIFARKIKACGRHSFLLIVSSGHKKRMFVGTKEFESEKELYINVKI